MDERRQFKILFEILEQSKRQEIFVFDYTPLELLPVLMEKVGQVGKLVFESHFSDPALIRSYTKLAQYREGLVDAAAILLAMVENIDQNKCDDCGQLGCVCQGGNGVLQNFTPYKNH